jgi:hypothetical protein
MGDILLMGVAGYLMYKANTSGGWGALGSGPDYHDPVGVSEIQEQQRDFVAHAQRFGEQPDPRASAWQGVQYDLARRVSEVPAANAFITRPGYMKQFEYMQDMWGEEEGQLWGDGGQAISLNPMMHQVRAPSQPVMISFRGSGFK